MLVLALEFSRDASARERATPHGDAVERGSRTGRAAAKRLRAPRCGIAEGAGPLGVAPSKRKSGSPTQMVPRSGTRRTPRRDTPRRGVCSLPRREGEAVRHPSVDNRCAE